VVWDYWWGGRDGESTTDQKMVTVQVSPCVPTPLMLILIFIVEFMKNVDMFRKYTYILLNNI
jgi:hypothetical protein